MPTFINNPYNSTLIKSSNSVKKWEEEQSFCQRVNVDGHQAHGKIFNILNHQGNANQNYNEISPHTSQNGCHLKEHG